MANTLTCLLLTEKFPESRPLLRPRCVALSAEKTEVEELEDVVVLVDVELRAVREVAFRVERVELLSEVDDVLICEDVTEVDV